VVWSIILAALALLSLALTLWQWIVGLRFPLHRRFSDGSYTPPVTLLKPLAGADAHTFHCLESWLKQDYAGVVQVLFGVAAPDDPACEIVRQLIGAHPKRDAHLVICGEALGANVRL